jgi:hypothetical protein
VIEVIGDFVEWGGGNLGENHQVGYCGFGGHGFDTRGCFLLILPSSRLGAAAAVFLVEVTLVYWGASVTGRGEDLGFSLGMEW